MPSGGAVTGIERLHISEASLNANPLWAYVLYNTVKNLNQNNWTNKIECILLKKQYTGGVVRWLISRLYISTF